MGKTRSSAVWVVCWRLVGLFGLVLILYLCNRPLKVYQSALVTSQVGSEKSIYLWLGLESSYPGSTKSWDQIFLPMHPLFPPHCNPRILCPENHFCFGFSCLSSPLSLSPAEPEKLFIFPSPLILLLQCKTEGSCKPFGEKITLCLDVTTLQQHRGPFLFSKN